MALDPTYFFYAEGTITLTNGSDIATGDFTAWDPAVLPFDFVFPNDGTAGMGVIKEVLGIEEMRLAKPWTGPTLTNVPYFIVRWTRHTDPRIYGVRVSDYLTRLRGIPENLEQLAQQIEEDAAEVAAALPIITQSASDVAADRQAVETAAAAVAADTATAETARDEAEAARDVAVSAASSTAALWNTRATAMAANIPTQVQYLRTAGYSSVGDGGGAFYKRLGAAPSPAMAWHFQSADGAWWELIPGERGVNALALGAKADNLNASAAANRTAMQAMIDFTALRQCPAYLPGAPGVYRINGLISIPKTAEFVLQGDGWNLTQIGGGDGYSGNYIEFGDANAGGGINSRISGIGFVGPLSGSVASAIRAINANTAVFETLLFQSVGTGINMSDCFAVTVRDCTWDSTPNYGIYSSTSAHNLIVDDCHFYTVGGTTNHTIRLDAATDNLVIQNSDFEFCSCVLQAQNPSAVRIVGNYIGYCVADEFQFGGTARGIVIENNWIALRQGGLTSTYDNITGGRFVNNRLHAQKIVWGGAVKDMDVGPNDVVGGSTLAPSPFTRITSILNTYTETDGSLYPLGYRRDQTGAVELRGQVTGGASSGSGPPAFEMPPGYRPAKRLYAMGMLSNGSVIAIIIDTNGNVVPQGVASGVTLRLDCIRFMAGN
jgi:hypothetical protein